MNEDQYYSPIIQAMIHTATLQKQGAQQEIEKQKNADEKKLREQGLKQAQQQIDQAHQIQLKQHDIAEQTLGLHRKTADIQAELTRIQAMKEAQGVLSGAKPGTDLNAIAPGLTNFLQSGGQQFQPQQSRQLPVELGGDQQQIQTPPATQDLSGLYDPEAAGRKALSVAKAESQGKAEGALPSEIQLKNLDNVHKLAQIGVQKDADKELAKIRGEYQLSGDRINGANHLQGIRLMHQLGLDDGSGQNAAIAKTLVDDIYNGTTDYNKLTPDQKRVVTGYAQGTGDLAGLPKDGKAYGAKLDAVSRMQTLMDQYRDLAANYSRDSAGSFGKGNISAPGGILQATLPGSDLKSKIDAMKGSGGALATFFDQNNRKSDAEIIRSVMASFDPASTMKQNGGKIQQHVDQLKNVMKQTFVGMSPDRINFVLGNRDIKDFSADPTSEFKEGQTATDSTGHRIVFKSGKWIDAAGAK